MSFSQIFGQILKEIRIEKKLSQEELGFNSGYHRTYISLLERGKKNPSLQVVFQLAVCLDITPSAFIKRIEKQLAENSRNDEELA